MERPLHNLLDRNSLVAKLDQDDRERTTLSLYRYANVANADFLRDHLFANWHPLGVLGRIYVSSEGINAQLSLPTVNLEHFKRSCENIDWLSGVRLNIAIEGDPKSFLKLIIKVRDKIVADGLDDDQFDVTQKGIHVNAQKFNELLDNDNTICVDMRNHYESEVGHFDGAVTPDVVTFRDELKKTPESLKAYKNKKIALYCTGGIRCEKASAWLKHNGYKDVRHLKGGIIDYAHQVEEQKLKHS